MRINLDRLERAGVIIDERKNDDDERIIELHPAKGRHLSLEFLIDALQEIGISKGIAHAMAEDVHIEAHNQSMLQAIKDSD